MNDEVPNEGGVTVNIEERPIPRSLTEYLKGKASASQYLDAIEKNSAPRLNEDERIEAIRAILADLELLPRLPELMRASIGDKMPFGIGRPFLGFGSEVIRALVPDQDRWGQLADITPEALLEPLARGLQTARALKERSEIAKAEALFLTGFTIIVGRADFDILSALAVVQNRLSGKFNSSTNATGKFKRLLARASVRSIESFGLLSRVIGISLEECRNQFVAVNAQLIETRERLRSAQDDARERAVRVSELESRIADLERELAQAQGNIASVEGGAAHDIIGLKARMRQFLLRRIGAHVKDAAEALAEEPIFLPVARQRLAMMRTDIDKELAWLDQ